MKDEDARREALVRIEKCREETSDTLDLVKLGLKQLPTEIILVEPHLTYLYCSHNPLTSLEGIGQLHKLTTLGY